MRQTRLHGTMIASPSARSKHVSRSSANRVDKLSDSRSRRCSSMAPLAMSLTPTGGERNPAFQMVIIRMATPDPVCRGQIIEQSIE
jgi:hypothetical protein